MSDPVICPVCGERHVLVGGGPDTAPAFACTGPRVHWTARDLRDIQLVSWGPDYAGYAGQARLAAEDG